MKTIAAVFVLLVWVSVVLFASKANVVQNNEAQTDQRPMLKVEGAKVLALKDSAMGLPRNALPGAKFITYAQWKNMKEIPQTGLYLVNMTAVPRELPSQLKEEGYTLRQDGTLLDETGKPVAVFTSTRYYQLQVDKDRGRIPGSLFVGNSFAGTNAVGDPYDFRCLATSGRSVYHGGFCRDYVARTYADAYGFDAHGGCTRLSPHTRIEYIETRAEMGSHRDRDSCRGCDAESSRTTWDLGCFWPAHGGSSSFHYVDMLDLRVHYTHAWTWTD